MSCQQYTTVIDDHEYSYTQLPARKSLKLKFKLFGILGKGVADLVANLNGSEEEQIEAFGEAVQAIFVTHDPDEIVTLIEQVLVPAFRDGQRVNFDENYTNNMMEMYKVLFWVLKQEFGDFFDAAGSLFPQLKVTTNG